MKFNTQVVNDVLVIAIEGEIMGGNEEENFRKVIYQAIENDQVNFVLDLAAAKWMNSSGLGMLITALTTVRSSGGDVKLANVSERVKRPIEITKLDTVFSFYNSVAEALKSF